MELPFEPDPLAPGPGLDCSASMGGLAATPASQRAPFQALFCAPTTEVLTDSRRRPNRMSRRALHPPPPCKKKNKAPRNKLPKETKNLCAENYDTDEKNQRQHKKVETYVIFLDWKNQNCQNDYTT